MTIVRRVNGQLPSNGSLQLTAQDLNTLSVTEINDMINELAERKATANSLGSIIVGDRLQIDNEGKLSTIQKMYMQGARTTSAQSLSVGDNLIFDYVNNSGNGLTYDTATGVITLPPNKFFKIEAHVSCTLENASSWMEYALYNTVNNVLIGKNRAIVYPVNATTTSVSSPSYSIILNSNNNSSVAFRVKDKSGTASMMTGYSNYTIIEV